MTKQIVIKVSDDLYDSIINGKRPSGCVVEMIEAIKNGKSLPVTCKNCKYYYLDEDGRGYHCERDSNVRFTVHRDFYCAGAEKRELK